MTKYFNLLLLKVLFYINYFSNLNEFTDYNFTDSQENIN